MDVIVSIVGVLAALIGLLGLVDPKYIVQLVQYWRGPTRFRIAIGVRIALGIALLVAAADCRLPAVVKALGIVSILAAIIILFAGQKRLDSFIEWWIACPQNVMRVSAFFAFCLGCLIVYSGA